MNLLLVNMFLSLIIVTCAVVHNGVRTGEHKVYNVPGLYVSSVLGSLWLVHTSAFVALYTGCRYCQHR